MAEMADILSDPGVCWVALLSSAGRTTLMVDDALGLDNPRIAISFLHGETIVSYRLDERIVGSVSHALSVCFDLDSGESTVLYSTYEMLDDNLQTRPLGVGLEQTAGGRCF